MHVLESNCLELLIAPKGPKIIVSGAIILSLKVLDNYVYDSTSNGKLCPKYGYNDGYIHWNSNSNWMVRKPIN